MRSIRSSNCVTPPQNSTPYKPNRTGDQHPTVALSSEGAQTRDTPHPTEMTPTQPTRVPSGNPPSTATPLQQCVPWNPSAQRGTTQWRCQTHTQGSTSLWIKNAMSAEWTVSTTEMKDPAEVVDHFTVKLVEIQVITMLPSNSVALLSSSRLCAEHVCLCSLCFLPRGDTPPAP